jgi:RimJ/RimL family protein N-acetyltransferase
MEVLLSVPASERHPGLVLRPWRSGDMPGLLAAVAREYPANGIFSHPDVHVPGPPRWTGPRDDEEAGLWLSGQRLGWDRGDWLTFAVLDAAHSRPVGHVGLKNREGGPVGVGGNGEIGYWTAAGQRGHGIAPAAVRVVTEWAFHSFGAQRLPGIMLVHDLDNTASCRVADKSGYPFRELSPAKPPLWFTDGHIHFAAAPRPSRERAAAQAADAERAD